MPEQPQKPRIFVSHSSKDDDWCRTFVKALRKKDVDVWYDRDSRDSQRFRKQIEKELPARPIFIVVHSPASLESDWVDREIDAAIRLHDKNPNGYRIIQVIAVKCAPPLLLSSYDNVCGMSEDGLEPKEAAKRVAQHLGIQVHGQKNHPVLVTSPSAKTYWKMCQSHVLLNQLEEALTAIEAAIILKPNKAQYWLDKGYVLLRLNRPRDADVAFDRARRQATSHG